jgi:hypothetical protein
VEVSRVSENGISRDRQEAHESRRRLRGFAAHLAGYFLAMILLVAVNFLFFRDNHWFVLPMVGWGSVLAVHAAYAMGLFKVFR